MFTTKLTVLYCFCIDSQTPIACKLPDWILYTLFTLDSVLTRVKYPL